MEQVKSSFANWRIVYRDEMLWAEILGEDGKYFWTDCKIICEKCGECLGCTRKLVFQSEGGEIIWNESEALCSDHTEHHPIHDDTEDKVYIV